MRNIILIIVALAFVAALHAGPVKQIGLGIDFPGTHTFHFEGDNDDVDSKLGFSPSLELLFPASPQFLVGGGVEFQIPRGLDHNSPNGEDLDATFGFVPLFLSFKLSPYANTAMKAEILAHFGYNIFLTNDDYYGDEDLFGGMYVAFGAGVVSQSGFTFDLMYRIHKGRIGEDDHHGSIEIDVTQTNITARIGRRF